MGNLTRGDKQEDRGYRHNSFFSQYTAEAILFVTPFSFAIDISEPMTQKRDEDYVPKDAAVIIFQAMESKANRSHQKTSKLVLLMQQLQILRGTLIKHPASTTTTLLWKLAFTS
jgi:hypothetical protein